MSHTTIFTDIFNDFQRFLKTENREIDGMLKEEVKKMYSDQYKLYRQQIVPDQSLPSFYQLFRFLYQNSYAHFADDLVHLGPLNGEKVKKVRNKGRNQQASKESSPMSNENRNSRTSYQSSKRKRHKVAVDQHLTFKSGLKKVTDGADFEGDKNLWVNVGEVDDGAFYCTVCQCRCTSHSDMKQHVTSRRHRIANSLKAVKNKKLVGFMHDFI